MTQILFIYLFIYIYLLIIFCFHDFFSIFGYIAPPIPLIQYLAIYYWKGHEGLLAY